MNRFEFKKVRRSRPGGSKSARIWAYEKPKGYGKCANDAKFGGVENEYAF